jgi:hypothetical protein
MKKNAMYTLSVLTLSLLAGCGGSDLIGKWQSEKMMGLNTQSTIEFKPGSIVSLATNGGSDSETKIDSYVSDKNRRGVVIKSGENKLTTWFTLKDKDTLIEDVGGIDIVFHRVK